MGDILKQPKYRKDTIFERLFASNFVFDSVIQILINETAKNAEIFNAISV